MRLALHTDPPRFGGAERYLVDLAEGAARHGHDVHLLMPAGPGPAAVAAELAGVATVHDLGPVCPPGDLHANVGRVVEPTRALARALRRLAPQVLHVSNGGYPGSDLCRTAVLATRRPTVMTVHAVATPRAARRAALHVAFDRTVWAATDRVVSATRKAGWILREQRSLPAAKLRIVPYGVARAEAAPAAAEAIRKRLAPGGELLVGMVVAGGSDPAQKGQHVLLQAVAQLAGVRAAFVGLDPRDAFSDLVAVAGDRVSVLGRVEDVGAHLAAFDALVVPSVCFESLPLVVLEAMSAGTPPVASRLAGIPEAVDDGATGLLVEPGSVGELRDALGALAADRGRSATLGAAARRRYQERFTVARMVEATLALYTEIAR